MNEAILWQQKENKVRCFLCPHYCLIESGGRGKCGVRENKEGRLYTLVYGKAVSKAVDPIEKKPLYHFMPGTKTFSIATEGCNLSCEFCQNWQISQHPKTKKQIRGFDLSPEQIVEEAIQKDCESIAYTYTEPTIFLEYALDTAKLAKQEGLKNVFVTNGFITKKAINKISPYLDAANIDLKGFSEEYYQNVCGGKLAPILEAIKYYHQKGIHIEITTLVVPGHNDTREMLEKIADFIASVGKNIPWHISRFHPHYRMRSTPATTAETIRMAAQIGKQKGIKHIYGGNIDELQDTICPNCDKKVIHRHGYLVEDLNLKNNSCGFCGKELNIK